MEPVFYSRSSRKCNANFVTVAYKLNLQGEVTCDIPDHCPFGADGSQCCVRIHSRRERKTGPSDLLLVALCTFHKRYFTLYPLGSVPYSRSKVAPVDDRGQLGLCPSPPLSAWRQTPFGAVVGLALGEKLPDSGAVGGLSIRQLRRELARAVQLCGLAGDNRLAEELAVDLGVGFHRIQLARSRYQVSEAWREQARVVAEVLTAIPWDNRLLERVLRAGARTSLWSTPWLWQGEQGYRRLF